jgi:uncharacterized protein (TIGR02246 family)
MRSPSPSRSWLWFALLLVAVPPSLASGQGIKQPHTALRTAADEIKELREAYTDAFNKKDSATVAAMYSQDAILIRGNGSVLIGQDAIRKAFATEAPQWPQLTAVNPDTLRVVGKTAWETGTTRAQPSGGGEQVSHYLIVLRRGTKYWKINSLAQVPVRADSAPPMMVRPSGDSTK